MSHPTDESTLQGDLVLPVAVSSLHGAIQRGEAPRPTATGNRLVAADEPIERIAQRVRALKAGEVAELGRLPTGAIQHWPDLRSDRIILTRERLDHLFSRHPETSPLLRSVLVTVLDPDEIHLSASDSEMAIFWRATVEERYFMRAAVWLPLQVELAASVISARKTRRQDFDRERKRGRLVWKRNT